MKSKHDPIRHAFARLLAQDSFERPYVDAALEALDALSARLSALEEVAEAAREYQRAIRGEGPALLAASDALDSALAGLGADTQEPKP